MEVRSVRCSMVIAFAVLFGGWFDAVAQNRASLRPPKDVHTDTVYAEVGEWFVVRSLEGHSLDLTDLQDRTLFVNFWATWCAPCIAEMPTIVDLVESVGDDVAFLLISVDDDERDVHRFMKKHNLSIPVYFRDWRPGESTFPARIIPATFVVNRAGSIIYKHHGAADWNAESFRRRLREWASK